jgi:hypothetical protein
LDEEVIHPSKVPVEVTKRKPGRKKMVKIINDDTGKSNNKDIKDMFKAMNNNL